MVSGVKRKGETRVCTMCVRCVRCTNVQSSFLESVSSTWIYVRFRSWISIHNFLRQTFTANSPPVEIRVERGRRESFETHECRLFVRSFVRLDIHILRTYKEHDVHTYVTMIDAIITQ